tara:strand:- start:1391 stop:2611 length:1221 start_codon:yes stop_codon:yes gene_type:complete
LTVFPLRPAQQRQLFLIASGVSTAGSFAGITAKGWILMKGGVDPFVLALNFAALSLPTLLISGPAGVRTDRVGCERVLVQAQWALLAAAGLGALAIPLLEGTAQVLLLLFSTLLVGIAGAYELTARNKYCSILVEQPKQLAGYLTSFSVVFNVGKLVGPPIGGLLVAATGPAWALGIDAASYLFPIASVMFLLTPERSREVRSQAGSDASLLSAWRNCGSTLRGVLCLTAALCVIGFYHPGLAPLIAFEQLGAKPTDLGLFTSVLAAGSIVGGVVLQRNSSRFCQRPFLTLGGFGMVTAIAQLGMARTTGVGFSLAMAFLIGAGTAGLLSSCNLITQIGSPQEMRGRMAGLSQIAFLGGGGISGLLAALLVKTTSLSTAFGLTGGLSVAVALIWMRQQGGRTLQLR